MRRIVSIRRIEASLFHKESFVFRTKLSERAIQSSYLKRKPREKKNGKLISGTCDKSERNQGEKGGGEKNFFRELRNLCETYFIPEILYLYIMYSDCGTSFYVILPLCYRVLD